MIEEIKDELAYKEEALYKKGHRRMESEVERIRRRYRKMIRKHRKDRPAPYESPAEIEACAGLSDDEEMQRLHVEYEAVRYGKM